MTLVHDEPCPGCRHRSLIRYVRLMWGSTSEASDLWVCFICRLRVHFGRERTWTGEGVVVFL